MIQTNVKLTLEETQWLEDYMTANNCSKSDALRYAIRLARAVDESVKELEDNIVKQRALERVFSHVQDSKEGL